MRNVRPRPDHELPGAAPSSTSLLKEAERDLKAVADAIAELAARGFAEQFEIDDSGVHCHACRSRCNAADVAWLEHVEVTSATGERMSVVCGLLCPICGMRGTATATTEQWDRRRHPGAGTHTGR